MTSLKQIIGSNVFVTLPLVLQLLVLQQATQEQVLRAQLRTSCSRFHFTVSLWLGLMIAAGVLRACGFNVPSDFNQLSLQEDAFAGLLRAAW